MTPRDHESDVIRSAVRELRAADERAAPSFGAVLSRRRTGRAVAWPVGRLVLAASLLLAVGAAVAYRATLPGRLTLPPEVVALSAWRPITDVLLETPNRSLLSETPRLSASFISTRYTGDIR